MTTQNREVRVWCIGLDGTEFYAAHSEEEMRQFYIEMVGKEEAEEEFKDHFREIPAEEMDAEFEFDDEGTNVKTTWRKLAQNCMVPTQISSGYN